MMLNDVIGDCAIVGPAHMVKAWRACETGCTHTIPDKYILKAYSAISGYDPATGDNDTGCSILDVCNYWRKRGIGGHKIGAHGLIDPHNHEHVKQGIYLLGGLDTGINMPVAWQRSKIWGTGKGRSYAAGGWGGHCVNLVGYDSNYVQAVTWGGLQLITWDAVDHYMVEIRGCISKDWVYQDGIAPSGFNISQLLKDLEALN
jgi:hypothetical protein